MHARITWAMALAAAMTLAGCSIPHVEPTRLTSEPARFDAGPPGPVMQAPGDRVSQLVAGGVRIDPSQAVGYEDLPSSITQLFNTEPLPLSLSEVVQQTLANNRGLRISGYVLDLAELQVPISKAIYDLMLTASWNYSETEEQNSGAQFGRPDVDRAWRQQYQVALSQLVPTGGTLALAYNMIRQGVQVVQFDSTLSPQLATDRTWQARTVLSFSQPLLNGLGRTVTNAQIRIAQLERQGAAADFQVTIEEQLRDALQLYWELIGAIEVFRVQVISYSAANDLLRVNRAKYEAGVMTITDVLQAEAAAEARRNSVIVARQTVRDLEDQLKLAIFLQPDSPLWEAEVRPTQDIAWREIDVELRETIDMALAERAELRRARSDIDQAETNERVARNRLLPALALVGEFDANGMDEGRQQAFANQQQNNNYSIGLEFSYPLQNRAARFGLAQARTTRARAEESQRLQEDTITFEVRTAVRALRTARERIDVTASQVRSEEAKLDSQRKRYDVGLATAFEVLDFQEDLAAAQQQYISAVVDYNQAAIELDRARGSLLRTYGVAIENADLEPGVEDSWFPVGLD